MDKFDARILIVDDDNDVLLSAGMLLKQYYKEVNTTTLPEEIPEYISEKGVEMILLDMNFSKGKSDGEEGIFWLKNIKAINQACIVIMITAYGDINLAISTIKAGAHDFIVKPWQNEKLQATVHSAFKLLSSQRETRAGKIREDLQWREKDADMMLFKSKAMHRIYETLEKLSGGDTSVLITGENGTGKEQLARLIHKRSDRKDRAFVRIDMASIPETLFESEIFGHSAGSFTGAISDKPGMLELADKGTVLLDEISNLTMSSQAKLLTAVESRVISRIGSNQSINLDIRIISATNTDLYTMVRENSFREDLLYRLNIIEIRIPSLRERPDDIAPLVLHYFKIHCQKHGRTRLKIRKSVLNQLTRYKWPGNIRELSHAVERAVIISDTDTLQFSDFITGRQNRGENNKPEALNLEENEKNLILNALSLSNGNITTAARSLGITRTSLYRRIEKHGL